MTPAEDVPAAGPAPQAAPAPVQSTAPGEMMVIPTRQFVLFPNVVFPVVVDRPGSVAAGQQAVEVVHLLEDGAVDRDDQVLGPGARRLGWAAVDDLDDLDRRAPAGA